MTAFIGRREFMTLVGGAAAVWPLAARAQQPVPVIGSIYGVSAAEWAELHGRISPGLERNGLRRGPQSWPSNIAGRMAKSTGCKHWRPISSSARSRSS